MSPLAEALAIARDFLRSWLGIGTILLLAVAGTLFSLSLTTAGFGFLGAGIGFFIGYAWGYIRGVFYGTKMDQDYKC